jgi:hypothetical protein
MKRKITQRCPVCGAMLVRRESEHEGWRECRTEYCPLFGMEGFGHHFEWLRRVIPANHPMVLPAQREKDEATYDWKYGRYPSV